MSWAPRHTHTYMHGQPIIIHIYTHIHKNSHPPVWSESVYGHQYYHSDLKVQNLFTNQLPLYSSKFLLSHNRISLLFLSCKPLIHNRRGISIYISLSLSLSLPSSKQQQEGDFSLSLSLPSSKQQQEGDFSLSLSLPSSKQQQEGNFSLSLLSVKLLNNRKGGSLCLYILFSVVSLLKTTKVEGVALSLSLSLSLSLPISKPLSDNREGDFSSHRLFACELVSSFVFYNPEAKE